MESVRPKQTKTSPVMVPVPGNQLLGWRSHHPSPAQPLTPLFLMDLRSIDTTSFPSTLLHLNPFVHVTRMLYGEKARRDAGGGTHKCSPHPARSPCTAWAGGTHSTAVSPSCYQREQQLFPHLCADKVYGHEIAGELLIAPAGRKEHDSHGSFYGALKQKLFTGVRELPEPAQRGGGLIIPVARGTRATAATRTEAALRLGARERTRLH